VERIGSNRGIIIRDLQTIRDEQLYKFAGYDTWEQCCREQWGWSDEHVRRLFVAEEYRAALPAPPTGGEKDNNGGQWNERCLREFSRIKDKKRAAKVAAKVLKDNPDGKITAKVVRRAVDEDQGIDRAAQALKTRRENEELLRQWEAEQPQREEMERQRKLEAMPTVWTWLCGVRRDVEKANEQLATMTPEQWEQEYGACQLVIKDLIRLNNEQNALLQKAGQRPKGKSSIEVSR
jgi:hypothetical protein